MPTSLGSLEGGVNGVFAASPEQPLVLLVDFKNSPGLAWHRLSTYIAPFGESSFLTHFNGTMVLSGPVTVIVSGSASFHLVVHSSTYIDIFYDAPLEEMSSFFTGPSQSSTFSTTSDGPSVTEWDHDNLHSHPKNLVVYSPANSYFTSVSFTKSI